MKKFLAVAVALAASGCSLIESPERDARKSCGDFLKASAMNPSSLKIPRPSRISSDRYTQTLEWDRGDGLQFMNASGVHLDASAVCVTSKEGSMVEELTLNGKKMFEDLSFRQIKIDVDKKYDAMRPKPEK